MEIRGRCVCVCMCVYGHMCVEACCSVCVGADGGGGVVVVMIA